MNKHKIFFLAFLLTGVCAIYAQDFSKKDIWEIGGTISYTSQTAVNNDETAGNSLNTFMLHVPVYYFVIDGLEVGLVPGYDNSSYADNSSSLFALLAGIAYNFNTQSNAYPYVEGRFGYNSLTNGNTRSGVLWSLNGGAKVQVGGNALIRIGLFYQQRTLNTSDNQGGRDGYNTWGIDAGFAVFFR